MAPRVKYQSDTNAERSIDGKQENKLRRGRQGQRAPINLPGPGKRRGQADEDESAAAAGSSSYLPWGQRMERQTDAWERRQNSDVQTLLATLPQQVAGQAAWRQAVVQEK